MPMQEMQVQSRVRKIPCRRSWHPTAVFLLGESYGQRSLAGYGPQGLKESDVTEQLSTHTHFHSQHWQSLQGPSRWNFPLPTTSLPSQARAKNTKEGRGWREKGKERRKGGKESKEKNSPATPAQRASSHWQSPTNRDGWGWWESGGDKQEVL